MGNWHHLNVYVSLVPEYIGAACAFSYRGSNQYPSQCSNLANLIPGDVFLPNASMYETSLTSYWSQQEQALQPSCIVRTGDLNGIAAAVKFLGEENHQNPGSCPFAVRSGG